MRSSVTVTGPPRAIWRRKIGTTEPDEPRTLPKRTVAKRVSGQRCWAASTANSASAFDAPITVAGCTALSVETSTKRLDARLARDPRDEPRGERVVAHRLDRVALHQPDVLVGGGVEDDVGRCSAKHLAHPLALLAVGEHGRERRRVDVAVVLELALDAEEVVLGVVDEDQPPRRDARDLAAQLGADRAAGAGDHDDLAGEVGADAVELHAHRLAAEDVLDLHLAHLAHDLAPPPACSSSKTVGSVRTGMPRSRAARTTRARSVPGADGIAIGDLVGLGLVEDARELVGRARAP